MGAEIFFQRFAKRILFVGLSILLGHCAANCDDEQLGEFKKTVRPFLNTYCVKCHNAKQQRGERRFDQLDGVISTEKVLVDYQDVLDLLNLGEMPPQKSKQPSNIERRQVVSWLTTAIKRYHTSQRRHSNQAVLRRLNSREYRNTVRDLLHLNMSVFDPTERFPLDQTNQHLDNDGKTLVTSGYLLQQYLNAADQVVDRALFPLTRPETQTWKFTNNFRQQPEIDGARRKADGFDYIVLYDVIGADKPEGAYAPIMPFADGVPHSGVYEIRFRAEGKFRDHPYDNRLIGTDRKAKFRLGIRPGRRAIGKLHLKQPVEPLLADIEIDDQKKWYTVRVWLDRGYTPRFTFRNGLMDVRGLWGTITKRYADQFPKRTSPGIVESRNFGIKYGKLPQIRIHEVEITGPLHDSWPRQSQRELLGNAFDDVTIGLSQEQIRAAVTALAKRAYRRQLTDDEVNRVMKIITTRMSAGRNSVEAFADGAKAILCSPSFLYLESSDKGKLSSTALATRLSYFLWSSMPDEKLMAAAADGTFDEEELASHVQRLLDDPRSASFVDGFLDSWLTLRELGSTPPDRSAFRSFYRDHLDSAMRQETQLFTRHVIEHNLSITNFLDSDFTFVNAALAKHYKIETPAGIGFKKVVLSDRRRGGLLGQASVLTVTANGIDTSPVVRGVWVLENLLGAPPNPPPPPDVEPLDPDIRGAKTIRD